MNRFEKAKFQMMDLDEASKKKNIINNLHPIVKILTTIIFLICVLSINKYDLSKLIYFILYPILLIMVGDIELRKFFKLILYLSPFLILFVISNIFLNKEPAIYINGFCVTYGMISALTLFIKNIYSILAGYILIATTGIYNICYGLNKLYVPEIITNQILLTYRYVFVLLNEAGQMNNAYILRAPKQKGIRHNAWGSLLGSLFLRSSNRADELYDSMILRGYKNKIYEFKKIKVKAIDIGFFVLIVAVLIAFTFVKGI